MLALDPDVQNAVYNYFYDIFQATVQDAIDRGQLDTGVKTLPGDEFDVKESRVISKDPKTGAATFYYPVDVKVRTHRVSPADLDKRLIDHATENPAFMVGKKGEMALLIDAPPIVHASGSVEPAFYATRPNSGKWVKIGRNSIGYGTEEVSKKLEDELKQAQSDVRSAEGSLDWARTSGSRYGSGEYQAQMLADRQAKLEEARGALTEAQTAAGDPMAWAKSKWAEQFEAAPSHITDERHLIGGAVMRFWNPISDIVGRPDIFTTVDSKTGKRIVGVDIPKEGIRELLQRITGNASTVNAAQLVADVLRNGLTYTLEGGIQVRPGRVGREPVVQLIPPNADVGRTLRSLGVLYEKGVQPIHYLPSGERGPAEQRQSVVAGRVLEQFPVKPEAPGEPEESPAAAPATPTPTKAERDKKHDDDIIASYTGAPVKTTFAGMVPKPLPQPYLHTLREKPDLSLDSARKLVGGFYESYGGGIDEIMKVGGVDGAPWYTVRDTNTGDIRNHQTFIDPRAVTFKPGTQQPASDPERGALHLPNIGPKLSQFTQALNARFGPQQAPYANYTGMGAVVDPRTFVSKLRDKALKAETRWVRGGAQTAAAAPDVHTALLRAATAKSQVAVMIATAHPPMAKLLAKSGLRIADFYRWGQQDRLYGIKQRWNDFASQPATMNDDDLRQAMTDENFLGLLSKVEGKKNLADNQAEAAEAILEAGDMDTLRDFLETAFKDAAGQVTELMPPADWDRLEADPNVQAALKLYKDRIESPVAQDHAINEGVFSTALGKTQTYFPLVPMEEGTKPGYSAAYPYKKPRNIANKFATGLSEDYNADPAAMRERFVMGVRANTKANFIQSALDAGLMREMKPGMNRETFTWNGQDYKASRPYVVTDARTIIQGGKIIHVRPRIVIMPEWFHKEIAPVLEGAKWDTDDVNKISKALLTFTLSGPAEAAFHWANVTGALVANTPFLQNNAAGKILSLPLLKRFAAIGYTMAVDPTTDEAAADLIQMAKVGAIPSRYASETYSKQFAEQMGAKQRRFSLAPSLFGPHGFDIRARLLMWRLAKELNPGATPQDLNKFVNQLGNYVPQLQGEMERFWKNSGVATFYTAGTTMMRNGLNTLGGTSPTAGAGGLLGWKLLTGALGTLALWLAIHQAATGKWPWEDPRSKFLALPVGGANGLLSESVRRSAFGRAIWGNGPETGYIGLQFFNPLVARGARTLGIPAAYDTMLRSGTTGQAFERAQMQVFNSLAHPIEGPPLRAAFILGLGVEGQLADVRDRSGNIAPQFYSIIPKGTAPGLSTLGKKGLALLSLNNFYNNLGEATGMLANRNKGDLFWDTVTGMAAPGLFSASNPRAQQQILREQSIGERRSEIRRQAQEALPHFAAGGIVEHPTKAVVGEAGPEKIVDLKKDPAAMARSGEDIIRGSSNIPLSEEGKQQAEDLAQRFKAKGFHGEIHASDLLRARQTAAPISTATESPIVSEGSHLHPWHLGSIEGQPTKQVLGDMNRYILKKPNVAVPGRGPMSSHDGEAFNSFKRRLLNAVIPQTAELKADPDKQIMDVTHYRDLRLIEAWVRRNAPKSMEIDTPHMMGKGDAPGSVLRLFWSGPKLKLERVNMKSDAQLPGGIFFVRHGITLWNGESKGKTSTVVDKPTVMTLAKNGPQQVVPLNKSA